jgi:hypothetical protein
MIRPRNNRRSPDLRVAGLVATVAVMVVACDIGDGRQLREPVFDLPPPPVTTVEAPPQESPTLPAPTATPTSEPVPESILASTVGRSPIEIERLSSPANATAEMIGTGALVTDPVTVDDDPADVLSFDVHGDGRFTLQVWIDDEGAHTVCVSDACGRVYTLAADAETPDEVIAKIEQALPLAEAYLAYPVEFPEWSVEIGGALSGTGGTTDADTKTITIYRNRGRSVDDFVRTILHEFGHVTDFERLDDFERASYLELRDIDPATMWRDEQAHRLDQWGLQPSEDFAEVMVAIWTDDRWSPRTEQLAPPPSADVRAAVDLLIIP